MCVFVFCGCICMISICVADNQLWLLWLNDGYQYECWSAIMDYMAHICMIIICTTPHISVWYWLLTEISVKGWQYQGVSGNQSMYVSMYNIQSNFVLFLSITQIILIVFFSGQINHLYGLRLCL